MNIDFSKAPEGATHVRKVLRSNYNYYKKDDCKLMCWSQISYKWVDSCNSEDELFISRVLTEIPKQNKMLIECKTEREKMLCEQVLRTCRGEKSQFKSKTDGEWGDKIASAIYVDSEYRAKPKKELVVPWDFIPDDVESVLVSDTEVIQFFFKNGKLCHPPIKLDLTDIELPVTVKRPDSK